MLYDKGVIGHVTLDLVSFPDPTSPNSHPLFWAVCLLPFLFIGLDFLKSPHTTNSPTQEISNVLKKIHPFKFANIVAEGN